MTTEKTITAEAYKQLRDTLNKVATDMNSIKAILNDATSDGTFDHRCASIELLACRSGALADQMAITLKTAPPVHGSLEEWLRE